MLRRAGIQRIGGELVQRRAANGRFGLGIVEYSLRPDHVHLLVEIDENEAELRNEGRRWVRDVRRAVLGQAPLAAFMVAYTFFGLWLLASPRG